MAGRLGALAEKLAVRRAIGVYVGDQEVTVSRVALGPFGPVELSSQTRPYEAEMLSDVLDGMLKPLLPGRRSLRSPVSIGLPTLRVFFASRPLPLTDKDADANVLLHDVIKSTNVNVDDLEVDLIKAQPGKKPLAVMVAGRRKYLSGLIATFAQCGVRPHRTEPAPFALLRLAALRYRAPKKAKTVVRVFLGADRGVAVLAVNDFPLAWRAFELPAGAEAGAVCSAAKAIQIVARFRSEVGACDAVLVHGRPDLAETFESDGFRDSLGVTTHHYPDPGDDGPSVALGLAFGAQQGPEAFDLSRAMKPKPPFREIFPVGDVAVHAALLVCVTLFLGSKDDDARNALRTAMAEVNKHKWMAKVDDAKLTKERKDLEAKVSAIREFLETRVVWTGYTKDASSRLPESLVLRSFTGLSELETNKGKVKVKKSLTLRLSAPISGGRAIPREIDDYLNSLRRDTHLRREFPVVELADLKWNQPLVKELTALAEFTIHCLPVERPKAPPGGDAPKAKKPPGD